MPEDAQQEVSIRFTATVARTGYSTADITVEADSAAAAGQIALAAAGDRVFSEHEGLWTVFVLRLG